jgi:hypothetical protein
MILIACQSSDSDITLKANLMKGASKVRVMEMKDEKQFIHLFWSKEYFKQQRALSSGVSSSSSTASTTVAASKKQLYQSCLDSIEKAITSSQVVVDSNHYHSKENANHGHENDDGFMEEEILKSPILHQQREHDNMMFDVIPSSGEKPIIGEKRTRFSASSANHKKVERKDGFSDSDDDDNEGMEEQKKKENGKIHVNYNGRYEETQADHYYDAMMNDDEGMEENHSQQQKNGSKRIKTTVSPSSLSANPVPFPAVTKSDLKKDNVNINDKDSSDDSEQEGDGEDDTTSLGSKQPSFNNNLQRKSPSSSQKSLHSSESATKNGNQGNNQKLPPVEQSNGFGNFMNTVASVVKPVGNKLFR